MNQRDTSGDDIIHQAGLSEECPPDKTHTLTEAELFRLLARWNNTRRDYPVNLCLHHLFEAQARRTPASVALRFHHRQLTFRELNERANQLAHHLRRMGVRREVLVGVLMPRSIEMVIGLLAILKAGGAYVPLDPSYPGERLSFMLEDARVPLLLTQERLLAMLPATKIKPVCVDADARDVARGSVENLESVVTAENVAYVIYTSGSTGRPKGIAIEHRNAVTLLHWARDTFAVEDLAGVVASTSISFDLFVFELFAPLSWGGTSVLVEDALQIPSLPATLNITLINTVPSVMAELLRVSEIPSTVRVISLAGEPLKGNLVRRIHQSSTRARLFNLYGPSEDTTYSTGIEVSREGTNAPPIGRPLPNTQIYLFDEQLKPVPVGCAGELYIGGDGLARGYLGRPELTAERFIPHPYSDEPGRRLYRTGDVARYLSDGNLEFVGRVDHQVKIRGYRVELGEIEARLEEHPSVMESAVVAHEDEAGDKRLRAYLVPAQTPAPSVNELRSFLKEQLPDYMLPSSFIVLDEFPRTPNGKIDRRALPVPAPARPHLRETFIAPRSPVEERLAAVWADVLKLDQVGVEDDFFALGGDSLLAVQIVSRIRQEFRIEMTLRGLFEHVTIAALAAQIDGQAAGERPAPTLLPASGERESTLSFAQQRLWLLDQLQPGNAAYNIPLVLHLKGSFDKDAMERAFGEIRRRHEVLRASFTAVQGEPVQSFSAAQPEEWGVTDLSGLAEAEREAEVRRLALEESQRPFDLASGPLLRTVLLRLGAAEHVLLVSMHHIVSDGWSIDIFIRELRALYTAYARGQASPLAELKFQYADFARFQREWLAGEVLERQLVYWRRQLAGPLPAFELPTDRPRLPMQTFRSGTCSLSLPESLTAAVKKMSQQESATMFMILLANFMALLYRYTGQRDIVIGTPVAGRNRIETEQLIGLFLNTLALRLNLSGNPSFRELLSRLRTVALEAYDHQDVPFELLLEELQVERDLSRTPLFQIMFNMLNYEDTRLGIELPELTVDVIEILEHGSKYDLTLYVREESQSILLHLVYNADLFDHARMASMLAHFQTLLEGVAAHPEQLISRLPLFTDSAREQILDKRNGVRPDVPFVEFKEAEIEQAIGARFEQQVSRSPQKLAVKTQAHRWTYEQLNGKANRVAHTLLKERGRKEERIALLFKHDAPMIAALLGALKAGKTYVPLDTAYPLERLAYVLEDAEAGAILTDNKSLAFARALSNERIPLINLDQAGGDLSEENPGVQVSPDSVAYLLYTSGSTGQPKGVMQSHRNVLHHIRCYTNGLHLNANDRLTLLSSYSFDAAVMDIFGALLNGAALYPVDLNESGFDYLQDCLIDEQITVYHSTPTVYRYFVGGLADREKLDAVRMVVLGGEEVLKMDVELYKKHFSSTCLFVNGFGPTESTLSLQYLIAKETEIARNAVPLGYAVEKTEILLLDEAGERVPVYGIGEISIRSEHVALGYWRNAELTAQAFLPDHEDRRKRVYRTGDLGQLLPDGNIEFKGRKDHQAKLRGYRIELGEIETVIRQHPAVCECVVTLREDVPGEKRLVAYLIPDEQIAPGPSEMRAFLSDKLPDYMLPSIFITLEELSLTPNGKVDRRALPAPDFSHRSLEEGLVAPRNPAERALASVWADVLRLEEVGIYDDFFELGGDSLMMSQLSARLRYDFSLELPMRVFFSRPTIALQAELLAPHFEEQTGMILEPISAEIDDPTEGDRKVGDVA